MFFIMNNEELIMRNNINLQCTIKNEELRINTNLQFTMHN